MNTIYSVARIANQINYILTKKQKRNSIIVFVAMIVDSIVNLLGVSVIYPFLQLMLDEYSLNQKTYVKWIRVLFPAIDRNQIVVLMGVFIILVFILKNVISVFSSYIQARYSAGINEELSVRVLNSYMRRPYEFFTNTDTNVVLRGLNGDVNAVYSIIINALQAISEIISVAFISIYLLCVDPFIAVLAIAIALGSFLLVTLGFKNIKKRLGREVRELSVVSGSTSYQTINGIKEITVLDRRDCFVRKYERIMKRVARKSILDSVVNAAPDRILEAGCIAGIMGVLCIKIYNGVDMETFIPTVGSFVVGLFRIVPSVSKIATRANNIVFFVPGMENTYQIIKDDEKIESMRRIEKEKLDERMDEIKCMDLSFRKSIEVNTISWRYQDGVENVLNGLSISIHRGESIGLIGKSGGGKSTFVDILMTLYKPQSGTIQMDGIDIFLMQAEWRKMIGYVPQSIFLVGDTVRANVAFGLEEQEISEEKVWKALEQSQLKEFIESLPNKLDTIVGERGIKFSGGQRQRIAIARALYNNPQILILDEATAALDNETERAFMESIEALQGKKTIILVAHRLTTIKNCDRVYEIRDGVAVERKVKEVLAIE